MTERPHYILQLHLAQTATNFVSVDPTFIDQKHLRQAWNMLNAFIMDMLDERGEEITDERFREIFIEMCYYLILHEMTTLYYMPRWERNEKERQERLERKRAEREKKDS